MMSWPFFASFSAVFWSLMSWISAMSAPAMKMSFLAETRRQALMDLSFFRSFNMDSNSAMTGVVSLFIFSLGRSKLRVAMLFLILNLNADMCFPFLVLLTSLHHNSFVPKFVEECFPMVTNGCFLLGGL